MTYFLIQNGAQTGPHTWADVKAMLDAGSITPETLCWREGQPDWQPLSSLSQPPVRENPASAEPRIYSGFWRRVAALLVDFIILGIFGMFLGAYFFNFFCHLGPYGPLLGLPIAWLYFGLQTSELAQGKTLGQRLLGIEVVGEDGRYLSVGRALLRYALWGVPYFLFTPLQALLGVTTPAATVVGMIFVTWFGLIVYLLFFNWPSRQVPHDLLLRTYVVRTVTTGAVVPAPFWKPHLAILGVLILIVCGLGAGGLFLLTTLEHGSMAGLFDLQKAVKARPEVQTASVMAGKNFMISNGSTQASTTLTVAAQWDGKPADMAAAAREIAGIVIDKGQEEAADKDAVVILISYGYNIGIARASISERYAHTLSQWQAIVQNSSAP